MKDLETLKSTNENYEKNKHGINSLKDVKRTNLEKDINSNNTSDEKGTHKSKIDKSDSSSGKTPEETLQENNQSENSEDNQIKNHRIILVLKEKKGLILKSIALFIGIFLIVYGVNFLIASSSAKVSSNVIFGDPAAFSTFLILIGSITIALVFSRNLKENTFLKSIYNELELVEGKTKKDDDDEETDKDKDINKSNH